MNFDQHFRLVSESCQRVEDDRTKLIESVLELSNTQKENQHRQRELNDLEIEISKLKNANKDLKLTLMNNLIERDELMIKKCDLAANIERLSHQLHIIENESDELLRADHVDHVCKRYSLEAQVSLLNKIQEAKNKLVKNGISLAYFL